MSLEIIENYLEIPENADFLYRINIENANNVVRKMAETLRSPETIKDDPKDGRKVTITLTADLETLVKIERFYSI